MAVLGGLLCARPAGADAAEPTAAAARLAWLQSRAAEADRALAALIAELQRAVDAGRRASALVIQGERPPAPEFEAAASAVGGATDEAAYAENMTARLGGTAAAVAPAHDALPDGPMASSLPGIAAQLTSAGEASGPFVAHRQAADATLAALGDGLAALEDDDPRQALAALDRADAALADVASWLDPPVVLPLWLDTTGALLSSARRMARAAIDGDAAALGRASRAYRAATTEARRADTALALAISESGAALAATPLRRLADTLAAAIQQRQAVASLMQMAR